MARVRLRPDTVQPRGGKRRFVPTESLTTLGLAIWEEWERLEHEDLFEPEVDSNNTNFNDDPRDIPF